MASGRIEQQIDLKVTGLKDVKDAEKTVKDLSGTKAKVTIEADASKAQRTVKDVLADVKKLSSSDAEIVLAIRAAAVEKELTGILADVATLDSDKATVDVELARANELRGDLDQLEGAIKELDATKVDIPVDVDTKPAQKGMEDIGKSADSAKSVAANAIGNMSQDISSMGGIAGTAGVAIGQMGEYMADAAAEGEGLGSIVKNFASAAGPMVGLSIAVGLVASEMQKMAKAQAETKKFHTDEIDAFTEALRQGGDATDNYTTHLKDMGKVMATTGQAAGPAWASILPGVSDVTKSLGMLGKYGEVIEDITHKLDQAGITAEQWSEIVTSKHPVDAMNTLRGALEKTNLSDRERSDILVGARAAQDDYTKAQANSKVMTDVFGRSVEKTGGAMSDNTKLVDENAQHIADWYAAQNDANDAATDFNDTVASTDFKNAELDGAVAGMSKMHDQLFGLADIAAANEEAWNNLGASLKENGKGFDLTTEKGRANQKALEDLSSTIDTQLAAAYDAANGNQQVFRDNATKIANDTLERLKKQFGLSSDQAQALGKKLGLLPEDIETRYQLSGTEEARIKIGLLQGAINNLPTDKQTKVTQQIIAGDYVGALNTVQDYYNHHQVTTKVNTEPGDVTGTLQLMQGQANRNPIKVPVIVAPGLPGPRDRGGYVGDPAGALVAERRPEFIRLPGGVQGLLTEPAVVPPGTDVTSGAQTARILQQMAATPSAGSTTVHVHLPRGSRSDDTVAAIRRYARRNGGRRR